ncbi:MAG: phosphoribosylformylglycinamidine synthase subunit PurL [Deltaproteobacteria bacterium]|nr:phosphoribosylformylglycinamidine synthase subunit PurL [Deltaproteobacteria bacterium]
MKTPEISEQVVAAHGLSCAEYQKILALLGRVPNITELGVFSVMWSEHCSYKSSKIHLKKLPTTGLRVVQGPGENAGVLDIGDGQVCVFKIESHNHPSFIEPYQGAATGVGGILRDIFTMGARPVALLNSLRFGDPTLPKTKYLVKGVVAGIGGYGNAFGCPTVGGEVFFHPSFNSNPLVNAFCIGIADRDKIFYGKARGVGNSVMVVGAKTGRDGIHGATMASREFDDSAESQRPTVQVGDPFMEKLLLEACLEVMCEKFVVGIQDMGAAGLTSSSVEMAARAKAGIELDISSVPAREAAMTPYEFLLSESQERMLLVIEKGYEAEAQKIFSKWHLDAAVIGKVTDDGYFRATCEGKEVACIPIQALIDEAPVYEREIQGKEKNEELKNEIASKVDDVKPLGMSLMRHCNSSIRDIPSGVISDNFKNERSKVSDVGPLPTSLWRHCNSSHRDVGSGPISDNFLKRSLDLNDCMVRLMTSPNLCSRRWVYRQYDYQVQTNTVILPGGDAAVIRLKNSKKALAFTTDVNSRYCAIDPYQGAMLAVAEASRNITCVGAEPIGVTNCLNFGNPERPQIMGQFEEVIRGMSEACRHLNLPIVSGNVSFYNETLQKNIDPTPVIGMVGLLDNIDDCISHGFQTAGDLILLVGENDSSAHDLNLNGSEFQFLFGGEVTGGLPSFHLDFEIRLQRCIRDFIHQGLLVSAHDVCDGGLMIALLESCFQNGLGSEINYLKNIPKEVLYFGESPSRILISVHPSSIHKVKNRLKAEGMVYQVIGKVSEGPVKVNDDIFGEVTELKKQWECAFEKLME